MAHPPSQLNITDLSYEIELLSYAIECVGQTDPCDFTRPTIAFLADRLRQHARQLREKPGKPKSKLEIFPVPPGTQR